MDQKMINMGGGMKAHSAITRDQYRRAARLGRLGALCTASATLPREAYAIALAAYDVRMGNRQDMGRRTFDVYASSSLRFRLRMRQ